MSEHKFDGIFHRIKLSYVAPSTQQYTNWTNFELEHIVLINNFQCIQYI